jgi:hypothetical protein
VPLVLGGAQHHLVPQTAALDVALQVSLHVAFSGAILKPVAISTEEPEVNNQLLNQTQSIQQNVIWLMLFFKCCIWCHNT